MDAKAKKSKRTTLEIVDSIYIQLEARGADPKYLEYVNECYDMTRDEQTTLQKFNQNVQIGDFEALKKKLKLADDYSPMTDAEVKAYQVKRKERTY